MRYRGMMLLIDHAAETSALNCDRKKRIYDLRVLFWWAPCRACWRAVLTPIQVETASKVIEHVTAQGWALIDFNTNARLTIDSDAVCAFRPRDTT